MNKSKTLFTLFISILLISLSTSCGALVKGVANKSITEKKGAIPPDFGKENTTVLFITHHKSYNKRLKKNVTKLYTGEYEFVSEEEFESNEKYNDIDKYRFVFDYNYKRAYGTRYSSTPTRTTGTVTNKTTVSNSSFGVKKFVIADRKSQKSYRSRITSSWWSKIQKVYIEKLNKKLILEKS